MTNLFISYRSLDSAKVDTLVSRLRSLKNPDGTALYDIWQDKYSIPVGQDWWKAIVQGIINCDIFVFMISRESAQNVNCRAELSYARKRNRAIIPIVLEDEFIFNPVTGKNDVTYWEHIPAELNDGRFQFLFYEGVSFVKQLSDAIGELQAMNLRDIPASEPPDPRNANEFNNDTSFIYDQACEFAWRLEFATAERLFQRLLNWNDPLFSEDAHEWILLLRAYEQLLKFDERESVRYKISALWQTYEGQFPKPFTRLFDPKGFKDRYGNNNATPVIEAIKSVTIAKPTRPSVLDILPPPFAWIDIPAGKVTLEKGGYVPEGGQIFDVPAFQIAKYPITNAQYAKFVEAGGYKEKKWWTEAGWDACEKGYDDDLKSLSWKPTGTAWIQPRYWADEKWNGANYPIVGVSWYESVAFCNWLNSIMGFSVGTISLSSAGMVSLPTEQQWQRAAQGDDNRVYPWGNDFDKNHCNSDESRIGKTTPVSQYEGKGDSPFGVVDMAGNVWEWCFTDYETGKYDLNNSANGQVLRGGSWDFSNNFSRTAYRDASLPLNKFNYFGFRCVCIP